MRDARFQKNYSFFGRLECGRGRPIKTREGCTLYFIAGLVDVIERDWAAEPVFVILLNMKEFCIWGARRYPVPNWYYHLFS